MDALDLLLETMDTSEAVEVTGDDVDDDVRVALEEFDTAQNPKDRAEALGLLMRLIGK